MSDISQDTDSLLDPYNNQKDDLYERPLVQFDQMARLTFQYLANYTNKNFLNSKRGLPK